MDDGNGRPDASDEGPAELPPGLAALFAIEACVGETIDALQWIDGDAEQALKFVEGIHRAVKVWLSWEMWAALLPAGDHTPDGLFAEILDKGVDVCGLGAEAPATPPETGHAREWSAFRFEGGGRRG